MSEPTVAQAVRAAARALAGAGVPDAGADARRLVAHAAGIAPDRLTPSMGDRLPPHAANLLALALAERMARRPVSQITGGRLFWGREFRVTPDVLDPRPETEALVAQALGGAFSRVLDLGSGSGCILVTLLAERPGARGLGVDLSPPALDVARFNAARHRVDARADFRPSDWWAAVDGRFDLVVSNPPYVALAEMDALEPEVRDHEPRMALTDGGDGLGAFRAILAGAPARLAPGGRLLLEIGPTQAGAVAALGLAAGLSAPQVIRDLDGRDRVVAFRAP